MLPSTDPCSVDPGNHLQRLTREPLARFPAELYVRLSHLLLKCADCSFFYMAVLLSCHRQTRRRKPFLLATPPSAVSSLRVISTNAQKHLNLAKLIYNAGYHHMASTTMLQVTHGRFGRCRVCNVITLCSQKCPVEGSKCRRLML